MYLFCATLPCDVLSGFLTFCDRVVYSSYLSAPILLGLSPLEDQECAAALMWVSVTVIFLVPAVIVTMEILLPAKPRLLGKPWVELREIAGEPVHSSKVQVL